MKKIITLFVFAIAMFLGTEAVSAQNNVNIKEVNAIASKKTEALRKFIKFDNDQRDQVYLAIQSYTKAKMRLEGTPQMSEASIEKLDQHLDGEMKEILTDEQYERYTAFNKE